MNNHPTEAEYAEAFGMSVEDFAPESGAEEPEGEEVQADTPAEETHAEGTEQDETAAEERGPAEGDDRKPQEHEMPPDERSKWASRRREWEAREAAASQARVDKIYADMFAGQTNPYTGKPINTEAEYKAYMAEDTRRKQEAQLQKAGIDPQTIQGMVDQQMAPYRMQMEQARMSAIAEKARAANARAEAAIGVELQKITAMDPTVKTLEDIAKMPTAAKFNDFVQKGIGMEAAFYLANRQEIDSRRMAAARAATQNRMAGKNHLNPVSGVSGKAPVQVPRGVVETYRAMMPDATDAEIQAAYEAEMKAMK